MFGDVKVFMALFFDVAEQTERFIGIIYCKLFKFRKFITISAKRMRVGIGILASLSHRSG